MDSLCFDIISKIDPDAVGGLLDSQEKNYQVVKSRRQAQELFSERERRRRLESEMEVYHAKENLLKDEIERLDTALHKVLCDLI